MEEKLSIRVNVADRYYPLKIDRKDEEKIRRAARLLSEKVLQYKQRYTDKDVQDFLAMAALQFVIGYIGYEDEESDALLVEEIRNLKEDLAEVL